MIGFLPILYDDELLSSFLMRLFREESYIYPKHFKEEILKNGKERFNYLYANKFKKEFIELLDRIYGYENVIEKHTLHGWNNLFGNYSGVSPTNGFIRYCPCCFKEKKYIQLLPQIRELNYCPEHGCLYMNSNISLDRDTNYLIKSIDNFETVNRSEYQKANLSDINVRISKYISDVLIVPRNGLKQAKTSIYLRQCIPLEYFYTKTRARINSTKIKTTLDSFYKDLDGYSLTIRQIRRVLSGESVNPFHICLIAHWLGISPNNLINNRRNKKDFLESKIIKLKNSGLSERQIANQLKISKTNVHKRLKGENK